MQHMTRACHPTETGRVFTWGRGNYGQLGRRASTSQSSETQPTTGNQDVRLPADVPALRGATQVRHRDSFFKN